MYLYKLEFSLDICPGVGLEDNTRNSVSSFLKDLRTAFHRESESEVAQSCLILCYPMDCSPPGSSVHGILQARVLEWVAISFSRGSSRPRDWTHVSSIADRCFTIWATREAPLIIKVLLIRIFWLHIGTQLWTSNACIIQMQVTEMQLRLNKKEAYWLT